jgi:hypothetical protein
VKVSSAKSRKSLLQKKFWLERGDMYKHMLEKIIGVGQGKRKYPATKCGA